MGEDDCQFLNVKPLSAKTTGVTRERVILTVMKHNLREIHAEFGARAGGHIDPLRIRDNVVLCGLAGAAGVAEQARTAMADAGCMVRKNAAVGIEVIVSLPARTAIDCAAYFAEATRWLIAHFGVPCLSAVIHNDEASPHVHIVLLPLRAGKLASSELLGGRAAIKALLRRFHDEVSKPHGLRQAPPRKRIGAAVRQEAMALAGQHMAVNLPTAAQLAYLLDQIKDPAALLAVLGLAMPVRKVTGSFVATMTRPCKNAYREFEHPKHL